MAKYFSMLLFTAVALSTTTNTNLRRFSAVSSPPPATSPASLPISPPSPATSPSTLPISPSPPPATVSTLSPPQPRSPVSIRSPPPPSPADYMQQQQLKNIIDALIGTGDFAGWANIIFNPNMNSSTPTSTPASAGAVIPTTATLFIPGDDALARLRTTTTGAVSFDPFIIPYHILPQRFTFSELRMLKTQTRIPTLLTSKTIVITNNTLSNFTIDDSLITRPDIYMNSAVCVHGIAGVLDYTVYGDAGPTLVSPPAPVDANITLTPEVVRNYTSVSVDLGVDFLIFGFVISSCFASMSNW